MMRAIEISAAGGPENLNLCERPVPKPSHDEIRIKVAYAGVNRPDCLQRAGLYAPPKDASDLPGLEVSGVVDAVGKSVTNFQIGDPVCALTPGGGYAEYVCAPSGHVLPIPIGLRESAAIPETYFTVWFNLFQRTKMHAGQSILIHGGSSGIGTTAIQLARWAGLRVFTTAGNGEKCDLCRSLGAETAINYNDQNFLEVAKANGGMDHILDMVGGPYTSDNLKALRKGGTLTIIAHLLGPKSDINVNQIMVKMLSVTGSTLRPQNDAVKAKIANELRQQVWPLLQAQKVAPLVRAEFTLEEAESAHKLMESGDLVGKIVLKVS